MGGEHRHPDMEVRYIKQGACYFDVRDSQDRWVRIEVSAGDHIVLPPKIYHRFNPSMIKVCKNLCPTVQLLPVLSVLSGGNSHVPHCS